MSSLRKRQVLWKKTTWDEKPSRWIQERAADIEAGASDQLLEAIATQFSTKKGLSIEKVRPTDNSCTTQISREERSTSRKVRPSQSEMARATQNTKKFT